MSLKLDKHIRLDRETILSPNLAGKFTAGDLSRIADFCFEGYMKDIFSRTGWFRRTEAAMDLAMQVSKEKSFPWPNASNIVFPLVTIAALQFHARAYPAIVQGTQVVKCRIPMGATPELVQKATRVGNYMSYQCLEEDQSWEEQHDRLLLNISIVGCAFKKSFYDPAVGHNTSQLVRARDLVVDYFAKSIESARRKTHVLPLYRNEIIEKALTGVYRDVTKESWMGEAAQQIPTEGDVKSDQRTGTSAPQTDWSSPYRGLEQHCWLDLDGDGYEEPYIVVMEEASKCILRIVSRVDREEDVTRIGSRISRIAAAEYFTKYGFIPAPDGGLYDVGFGVLLGPLNESANSIINQLVDAGTMANTAGGFLGRGAKIRGGVYTFSPMEWKRVDSTGDDLRKNIVPLEVREPSQVLFSLLGLLIDYTNRVSGATEMLTGQNPGQNTKAGTADHMVEQGLKIYAAIFKRVWRSMKEEFKKLYVLNAIHLPQRRITFSGITVLREDFLDDPNHVVPCADPNIVSDQMRIMQAQMLAERAQTISGYDPIVVERNLLEAFRIDAPERFYPGPKVTGPLGNPKVQIEEIKTKREEMKLRHQAEQFAFEMQEQHFLNEATIAQLQASATKLLADADGVQIQDQINAINATVAAMKVRNEGLLGRAKLILEAKAPKKDGEINDDQSGAIQHLVGRPGDKSAEGTSGGPAATGNGVMG